MRRCAGSWRKTPARRRSRRRQTKSPPEARGGCEGAASPPSRRPKRCERPALATKIATMARAEPRACPLPQSRKRPRRAPSSRELGGTSYLPSPHPEALAKRASRRGAKREIPQNLGSASSFETAPAKPPQGEDGENAASSIGLRPSSCRGGQSLALVVWLELSASLKKSAPVSPPRRAHAPSRSRRRHLLVLRLRF